MAASAAATRPSPRLQVTVSQPDGVVPASRGLAQWLSQAAPARARGEVTVAVVKDSRIRSLNRVFRGKDAATDVLSFPVVDSVSWPARSSARFLGDIVIAVGVAGRHAADAGHPLSTELRVLALHGLLHLLGHDHETDDGAMARLELRLRRRAGLREGLLERAPGPKPRRR